MITALVTLVAYLIGRKNSLFNIHKGYQNKSLFIFLCFVLWLLIVTVFAKISVQLSFNQTVEIIKIFVLCFLFARLITTKNRIELYVWVTSISFGMLSFWGFLQALRGNSRLDTLWPGGSNYIAAQFALMAPFVLAKAFDTALALRYRLGFFACTLSVILCSIYTDSRGGFLGLVTGLFIFLSKSEHRLRIITGMAILIFLIYPWIPDDYFERIGSIYAEGQRRDTSAESRFVLWQIAFRIWQDHPITGVGLGNFSSVKETYADKLSDIVISEELYGLILNQERRPHGLYTGMMAETGLIGIGLYLILLFRGMFCRFPTLLTYGTSMSLQVRGAQAGLVGFAIAGLFGDYQYIETFYMQLFFIGAVRGYADSFIDQSETGKSQVAILAST
jgi:probable O-glycosylation ligase (exosortase A-associated)